MELDHGMFKKYGFQRGISEFAINTLHGTARHGNISGRRIQQGSIVGLVIVEQL